MQDKAKKTLDFSVVAQEQGYGLQANGKEMCTPGKLSFRLPSKALAEAICWEWQSAQRFSPAAMPLTSLAYTAIDRIEDQKEAIIEALLVYVDTDTLSYRDTGENTLLAQRQKEHWDPVIHWVGERLGHAFQTTTGIMPIEQPTALIDAFRKELETLDAMRLSAASVLASCCSSMVLGLAVVRGHVDAEKAFALSRLEEDTQAEVWGRDEEANARAERLKNEIVAATRFLRLLERE
jgi:chaperone required for assembly of F1-ATPase